MMNVNPGITMPLDPKEALGNTDDTGSEILQDNIWVDDWLVALVNGVEALQRGEKSFSADIQSESNPIVFASQGERFSLSFANTTLIGNLSEFRNDLKQGIQKLLAAFDPDVSFRPDSFWAQLQGFAV
jgi:hypothetical protein